MRHSVALLIQSEKPASREDQHSAALPPEMSRYFPIQNCRPTPSNEENNMSGLELLLMPLFTMGSMIVFALSQIRANRDR